MPATLREIRSATRPGVAKHFVEIGRIAGTAAAEELLEKIAETSATEMKLLPASRCTAPLTPRSRSTRRRIPATAILPVGSELVIFAALFRVTQDFVGFIDLLEFLLGLFFVFRDVRMILPGQLAKRLLDLIRRGVFRNA